MKKIVGFSLSIIFIAFLLLLFKYLLIEEILGFYFLPILLVVIVATIIYCIIRIFIIINYKKFILNFLLIACALQILILSVILSTVKTRYFYRDQVINDIDCAVKLMEDVHPNLYAKISKKDFFTTTDSLKSLLPLKISDIEAFKTLCKILSQIGDGHTTCVWDYFLNWKSVFFRKTFPYDVEIKNERIFVTKNYFYRRN